MFNKLKLIYKEAKRIAKEEMEFRYNCKKLQKSDCTTALLQEMINRVNAKNVKIEVKTADGAIITITPVTNSEIAYESFKDKFAKNRQNVRQI